MIRELNEIIRGWVNNHRHMCSKETFKKIDKVVFESLWKWAKRRHNSKIRCKDWLKERYWQREGQRDWIFRTAEKKLEFASDTKIVRHRLIKFEANPYLQEWKEYYTDRKLKQKYDKLRAELVD